MPLRSLEILRAEHRAIAKALADLEGLIDDFLADVEVPEASRQAFNRVADFFAHDFLVHIRREDVGLLPSVAARLSEGTAALLDDHAEISSLYCGLLAGIRELGRRAATTGPAAARIRDFGRALIEEMREHQRREERTLFPLVESLLTEADDERIVARFEDIAANPHAYSDACCGN